MMADFVMKVALFHATTTVAGQPLPTGEEDNIYGFGGDDTISGLGGNDFIDGGAGDDVMRGGTGNDTYVVGSRKDVVIEESNNGIDTVQSSVSYSLSANVENLTFTGTADVKGTGNDLDNAIVGNAGANVLAGMGGLDVLTGSGGSDRFVFNSTSDSNSSASDVINDFVHGVDRIDLSAIDANVSIRNNQAFVPAPNLGCHRTNGDRHGAPVLGIRG